MKVTSNAKIAHVCVGDSTELELDCQLVSEKWILGIKWKLLTFTSLHNMRKIHKGPFTKDVRAQGGGGSGEIGQTRTQGEGVFAHCGRPGVQNVATRHFYYSPILD